MSAELLSTLNAIRNQIENSSDEELLAHLMQGFLNVCDLLNKHPDELGGRVPKSVLQEVLETVSTLLTIENNNNAPHMYKHRHICEVCQHKIATPIDEPKRPVPIYEPTDESLHKTNLSDRTSELSSADDERSSSSTTSNYEEDANIASTRNPSLYDEILAITESITSDDSSSSESWFSAYSSISSDQFAPVDQKNVKQNNSSPTTPSVTGAIASTNSPQNEESSISPTVSKSPTVSVDDETVAVDEVDCCSLDHDDHTRYAAFDRQDYRIVGELLHCLVCEMNVYGINAHHIKLETHRKRLRATAAALKSTDSPETWPTPLWQVTATGFLQCTPCRKQFCIRTAHSSAAGDMHARSKKYKTCERVSALKRRVYPLWKSVPTKVFDDLLTLRLTSAAAADDDSAKSFCVGCDRHFDTPADRRHHEQRSLAHRACVQTLRRSDIFAYSFGILSKGDAAGQPCALKYCVLCKIGVSNFIEHDNHVHGANSQHGTRLRTFRAKVFPQLEKEGGLANAFHRPANDTARYSLDLSLDAQVNYFESLLHVIVISTDGFSLCSLCDQYVCGRSMRAHCDTAKHAHLQRRFLDSFRDSSKRSGVMRKNDMVYCVLCHVAFSNDVEATLHVNSTKPHLERVQLFGRLFARFIKSVIHSG